MKLKRIHFLIINLIAGDLFEDNKFTFLFLV